MWKGILGKGKCALGFHDGHWQARAEAPCTQVQICQRCGKESVRVEHSWGEWDFVAPDRCDQVRVCRRCSETAHETVHDWTEPHYLFDTCDQARTCTRCREQQPAGTVHAWDEWVFLGADNCQQVQLCARCGTPSDRSRTAHRYGPWRYSEDVHEAVHECRVCSAIGTRSDFKPLEEAAYSARIWSPPLLQGNAESLEAREDSAGDIEQELLRATSEKEMWLIAARKLQEMVDRDHATGKLSELRSQTLGKTLEEFEEFVENAPADLAGQIVHGGQLGDLLRRLGPTITTDSNIPKDVASRAATLLFLLKRLNDYLVESFVVTFGKPGETHESIQLMKRLGWARTVLRQAKDDESVYRNEQESLRQLALDFQVFAQRHHLTVAKPLWGSVATIALADGVFYSGGDELREHLTRACRLNRLRLLEATGQGNLSRFRYERLQECHVAVFDLTAYDRDRELDSAALLAPAAYELGIALALGKPIVVVGRKGSTLPFDVDVEPVYLSDGSDNTILLARALDHAVYGLQRGGAGDSVAATAAYVRCLSPVQEVAKARIVLSTLSPDSLRDALTTRHVLVNALSHASLAGYTVFLPSWATSYPDQDSPRCFHITAYRPWARESSEEVRAACDRQGIEYIRGDEIQNPDIVKAIWEEIGHATHVVVDLSALNLNAVMELGMVHTLGRLVLIVGQEIERIAPTFPAVAKLRQRRYSPDDLTPLRQALDGFLSQHPNSVQAAGGKEQ